MHLSVPEDGAMQATTSGSSDAADPAANPDGPSGHILSRRYTVLVAEDHDDMRALVCGALTRDGYQAVGVADGGQLLDYLRAATSRAPAFMRPHLLVTDLRMPCWTGLDALSFLKAMAWKLPVIVVTAFGSDETHQRATALGAFAVLDKPFPMGRLRAAVFEALWEVDTGRGWRARLSPG